MDNLKRNLWNFMQGRNGVDDLGKATMWLVIGLMVLSVIFQSTVLNFLATVLAWYALYRMFSRKVYDRRLENNKYLEIIKVSKMKFQQRRDYKIFRCKGCGKNVRVPRKKGKIEVTCPVCGSKTIHRT